MEIHRVVPSGYCKGVINAINIAKKAREDYKDKNIYVLGMIVHNSYVTSELEKLGIVTLDDSKKSKEELIDELNDCVVIFTAHGISDKIKQKAIDKGLITVDASCVDVLKTQDIVKDYLNKGYDIIYFGKAKHPEAEAVISISDKIHMVTKLDDIEKLNIDNDKIFITNQTTMSYIELQDMFDLVKKKYPSVTILKEICNATSSRQKAVFDIKDGDVLYVVGDKKSNNTNKLVEIAKRNIKHVYLINSKDEIKKDDLIGQSKIYVTAGASTPPVLINEVIDYLNTLASKSLQ